MARQPHVSHEDALIERFRRDPALAARYLSAVLEDGEQPEVMTALRRLTEAFGGVPKLARTTALNTTTLYRTLSPQGNPELKSLMTILKAMGLRLAVETIAKPAKSRSRPAARRAAAA